MYKNKEGLLVEHLLVVQGDSKLYSIAAASILAKVYHDEYVEELCKNNPEYNKYDWLNNMCYGTAKHIAAIKEYGLTKHHRKTFLIKSLYYKSKL